MTPVEQSSLKSSILHKLKFHFGTIYLCQDVIVSEIYENQVFGVEEANVVVEHAVAYYEKINKVKKRVYIANRIHKYSVKPTGWFKFGYLDQYLIGYAVVDNTRFGFMNAILESKFVPINFKAVKSLDAAMEWARSMKKEAVNV